MRRLSVEPVHVLFVRVVLQMLVYGLLTLVFTRNIGVCNAVNRRFVLLMLLLMCFIKDTRSAGLEFHHTLCAHWDV